MKWQPIETCPKTQSPMFVVVAIDVKPYPTSFPYTTDPYCVWYTEHLCENGSHFARWPHPYPPTHWCELPNPKERAE